MLICVVILFLLCWGPRFIMELLMKMQFSWLYYEHVYIIRIVLFLLPMIHAILNPVVYFIMSNNFRNSVLARCTDCPPTCCRRPQAHGSFGDLGKYIKVLFSSLLLIKRFLTSFTQVHCRSLFTGERSLIRDQPP